MLLLLLIYLNKQCTFKTDQNIFPSNNFIAKYYHKIVLEKYYRFTKATELPKLSISDF